MVATLRTDWLTGRAGGIHHAPTLFREDSALLSNEDMERLLTSKIELPRDTRSIIPCSSSAKSTFGAERTAEALST